MKLDLNEIAAHLGKRIRYDIDEPPLKDEESGISCVEPITGRLTFSNSGSLIVVRGRVQTVLEVQCSRCLQSYHLTVDLPIEEELTLSGNLMWDSGELEEEVNLPEEAREPIFSDHLFNLTEVLRQTIATSVPIRTLCSEDCKGICLRCGCDLNAETCDCADVNDSSPFAVLAELLANKRDDP